MVAASVPPWGFWVAAFPGLALLAWSLEDRALRRRLAAGLAFAVGLFGPTLFWVTQFHAVGYLALVLLEAAFVVAAVAAVPAGPGRVAALPGALVLAEAARGAVPFGGFPMGGIPLGQAGGPLAPAAALGGALLVAGLAVGAGTALAAVVGRRWVPAAVVGAVVVAAALAGPAADRTRDAGHLRVALVQGGGERGLRAVESDPESVLQAHLEATRRIAGPVDLVVWPENVVDVPTLEGSPEEAALAGVARGLGATLLAGVTEDVGARRFRNLAVAWAPDGQVVASYVKQQKVPFGEYVPLRGLFERLVDLRILPRDAVAGRGPGLLRTPAGPLGVAISYEVFFPERGRAAAAAGGQILLVPTNASSFTSSQVPTQEVAAARLQARATGRWVAQAAPTGYTALVAPDGQVVARSRLGRAEVVEGRAGQRSGRTLHVALGDGPVLAGAVLLVGLGWAVPGYRRRPVGAAAPSYHGP